MKRISRLLIFAFITLLTSTGYCADQVVWLKYEKKPFVKCDLGDYIQEFEGRSIVFATWTGYVNSESSERLTVYVYNVLNNGPIFRSLDLLEAKDGSFKQIERQLFYNDRWVTVKDVAIYITKDLDYYKKSKVSSCTIVATTMDGQKITLHISRPPKTNFNNPN